MNKYKSFNLVKVNEKEYIEFIDSYNLKTLKSNTDKDQYIQKYIHLEEIYLNKKKFLYIKDKNNLFQIISSTNFKEFTYKFKSYTIKNFFNQYYLETISQENQKTLYNLENLNNFVTFEDEIITLNLNNTNYFKLTNNAQKHYYLYSINLKKLIFFPFKTITFYKNFLSSKGDFFEVENIDDSKSLFISNFEKSIFNYKSIKLLQLFSKEFFEITTQNNNKSLFKTTNFKQKITNYLSIIEKVINNKKYLMVEAEVFKKKIYDFESLKLLNNHFKKLEVINFEKINQLYIKITDCNNNIFFYDSNFEEKTITLKDSQDSFTLTTINDQFYIRAVDYNNDVVVYDLNLVKKYSSSLLISYEKTYKIKNKKDHDEEVSRVIDFAKKENLNLYELKKVNKILLQTQKTRNNVYYEVVYHGVSDNKQLFYFNRNNELSFTKTYKFFKLKNINNKIYFEISKSNLRRNLYTYNFYKKTLKYVSSFVLISIKNNYFIKTKNIKNNYRLYNLNDLQYFTNEFVSLSINKEFFSKSYIEVINDENKKFLYPFNSFKNYITDYKKLSPFSFNQHNFILSKTTNNFIKFTTLDLLMSTIEVAKNYNLKEVEFIFNDKEAKKEKLLSFTNSLQQQIYYDYNLNLHYLCDGFVKASKYFLIKEIFKNNKEKQHIYKKIKHILSLLESKAIGFRLLTIKLKDKFFDFIEIYFGDSLDYHSKKIFSVDQTKFYTSFYKKYKILKIYDNYYLEIIDHEDDKRLYQIDNLKHQTHQFRFYKEITIYNNKLIETVDSENLKNIYYKNLKNFF